MKVLLSGAGFTHNFAYAYLALNDNSYVRLVDDAHNSNGTGVESSYVNELDIPSGSTLDLNGLNAYVRTIQVDGTVQGGIVQQLGFGGPLLGLMALSMANLVRSGVLRSAPAEANMRRKAIATWSLYGLRYFTMRRMSRESYALPSASSSNRLSSPLFPA